MFLLIYLNFSLKDTCTPVHIFSCVSDRNKCKNKPKNESKSVNQTNCNKRYVSAFNLMFGGKIDSTQSRTTKRAAFSYCIRINCHDIKIKSSNHQTKKSELEEIFLEKEK